MYPLTDTVGCQVECHVMSTSSRPNDNDLFPNIFLRSLILIGVHHFALELFL